MLEMLPKNLEQTIKAIGSDWCFYNIDVSNDKNTTTVKIASSQLLSGTIRFIYDNVNDEVNFITSILTDADTYKNCVELINKFKNTKSVFNPTNQNFDENRGVNGMINVKIILCDENIDSIYQVLEMIEFKKKNLVNAIT